MAGADAALPQKLLTRIPVIVGPTGIGKSRVAFELALQLGGEIVVADSRQVYGRLDIATNKPSPEQVELVRSVIRKKGEAFVAYSLDDVLERIA